MIRERVRSQEKNLENIAGQVFNAYRVALGDDFTTQEVIRASSYGSDVKDWDSIGSEMQDTLQALCVRHPESVDKEKASSVLAKGVEEYLRKQGINIPEEQALLMPDLMKDIMPELERAGAKFSNGVRKARILGLKPLVDYEAWLVNGGQTFMDLDQYGLELKLVSNAIIASQNAFTTALVVARDVEVHSWMGKNERIEGITEAGVKAQPWKQGSPFVVTYETKGGKKGEIDVLRELVTSLTEKADEQRLYNLIRGKGIVAESGLEPLGYEGSVESLVGLPQDVNQELRANVWRKRLKRFGADFTKDAEMVLVEPSDKEKVTFFYPIQNKTEQDNNLVVAFRFDERYNDKEVFVCTRERMDEYMILAKKANEFEADYNPFLEPMAVRTYVKRGRRLAQHQP